MPFSFGGLWKAIKKVASNVASLDKIRSELARPPEQRPYLTESTARTRGKTSQKKRSKPKTK